MREREADSLFLPQEGDQLEINYSIWKGDSLLLSSAQQMQPVLVEMPSAKAHNLFTEALSLMAEGDSLEVLVLAEEAADILGPYAAEFGAKERVRFGYRLKTLKSKAQLEAEIQAERARVAERRAWILAELEIDSSLNQLAGKGREGLRFKKLKSSKGPKLQLGQLAQIQYICLLPNGEIIDDSFLSMRPIWVELGDLKMIRGWSLALQEFAEGEQGLIYLPAALAYGQLGNPPFVPPNSPLIFYIEVLTTK
ncbi:FKBP-type peptidyl-prolyl cis-trans isomerase [Saprospira sp. CCB-QB6]|uniref:FKBP-type peptidyl-prolyl cis-trans isomerase n=1 Tax=Saprospira sp. CCB-QB6 TaxID=3023936 RepID=UPI00234AB7E1|nr:FKBP-type peptidyl-prolyl cis-trans isomerase [Saprospira sp. CCB-QB6]WCL82527.1 FKBP-type peptidyl-prolyl cis-trans isomerase [Saprospira sp. CCB-QB6]